MPLQIRLSPTENRLYSPDRDLAYCSAKLVMRAIQGLDPERQEPWVLKYLADNKIVPDELVEGAMVMAKYLNHTLLDPQYKQPFEALEAAGFFKLSPAVQTIICAKVGQVFISAFFPSIRDVTRDPTDPPLDTEEIEKVAVTMQNRMWRHAKYPGWVNWCMDRLGW